MGDGDVEVPAQEQGVLMELPVKEGQPIKKDAMLGQIDDSQAKMAEEVARNQWLSAQAEAENEVSILYARAAFAVAQAEVQQARMPTSRRPTRSPTARSSSGSSRPASTSCRSSRRSTRRRSTG